MLSKSLIYWCLTFCLVSCTFRSSLSDVVEKLPPPPKGEQKTTEPGEVVSNDQSQEIVSDFFQEKPGSPPISFLPVVGQWIIATEDNNNVLKIDGSDFKAGTLSPEIAKNAKDVYGDRAPQFLEALQNYKASPFALLKIPDDFKEGEIRVQIKFIGGKNNQAAGIIWGVNNQGDYLGIRLDALNQTLSLYDYRLGKLNLLKKVENVAIFSQQWQQLTVTIKGSIIQVFVNEKLYLEYRESPVEGKVGVWDNSDNIVYFDNFTVIKRQS